MTIKERDVIVIGAGQAGLAMSFQLQKRNIDHVLLEKGSHFAGTWKARYKSLQMITPNWMNSLPGTPFPGDANGFASRDEVIEYLKKYAEEISPPTVFGCEVTQVIHHDGWFEVETSSGKYGTSNIVSATGPFQVPHIPAWSENYAGVQLHSDEYLSERDLPGGSVLVVGSGNSGVQIAKELSSVRQVWLSREKDFSLPRQLTGKGFQRLLENIGIPNLNVPVEMSNDTADLMWWMQHMGLYDMPPNSRLGELLANGVDPYIGEEIPAVADRYGIKLMPKVVGVHADQIKFDGGETLNPGIVIWATGFRHDYSWAEKLMVADRDSPIQTNGISPLPGFYFLGLRWMRRADSGLLKGVGRDAEFVANEIFERLDIDKS